MYANEEKKRILSVFANFIIWVIEVVGFAILWHMHYTANNHFYLWGNVAIISIYGMFMFLLTKSLNGYKNNYMKPMDLFLAHTICILFGGILGYLFACLVYREYVKILPILILVICQFVLVQGISLGHRHIYLHFFPPRKVIVIYGNYPLDTFLKKLNARTDKFQICEILNYHTGMEKIKSDVLDFEGVILYDLPAEERNIILKYCYEYDIRTYVVPKISDILLMGAEELHMVDTPIYLNRNCGLHVEQRIVKRTADIVISLIALIIALPIMLLIALIIKIYDHGPIFYKQIRLTRNGKEFQIYKFRSMRVDAEAGGAMLAKKEDDRITPVGKVLRNLHLDELPQLINVLKGDMSMVGPRPERPEIFEQYKDAVPDFDFRLKVKAGLTGYAQVYGKYNTTPIDKLKMDLTYIQDFSYWLDIKLLILTFRIIFQKETSEGVDSNQKNALK